MCKMQLFQKASAFPLQTFYIFILLSFYKLVETYSLEDAERLLSDKTAKYNKQFRPVYNQSEPLDIYTGLDLVSIQEFDEVLEKITITGIIYLAWHDEKFTWNPDDYGGVTYLIIDTTKIWIPYLLHTNTVEKVDKISEDWHLLSVNYKGEVSYFPGDIFSSSCSIDVTYYPWDRQVCDLFFMPWGYTKEHIRLIPYQDTIFKQFYTDNGAWTLVNGMSFEGSEDLPMVVFRLVLDRKPRFVVVNVIIPIIFMSFLNVLIFLIPHESGERISYCITVLLAIAVFLTLVGDNLPKTSNPMSLYSYYLVSVLVISVCITISNIFCMHLYHKDEEIEVGSFWRCITMYIGCKCRRYHKRIRYNSKVRSNWDPYHATRSMYGYNSPISANHSHNGTISMNIRSSENSDIRNGNSDRSTYGTEVKEHNVINISWRDVSVTMDKILFVLFFVCIAVDTIVFVLMISGGQSKHNE